MKKIISIFLIIMFVLSSNTVYGALEYTENEKEYIQKNKEVYIAGSQKLEFIENYKDGSYIGILPDIFNKISELTGISFTYINEGQDWKEFERNNQIEIISGVTQKDIDNLNIKEKIKIINVPIKDSNEDIYIVFTQIADDELIKITQKAIDEINKTDMQSIIFANTIGIRNKNINEKMMYVNIGVILLFIVVIVFLYKKYKKELNNEKYIDNITETGNYKLIEEKYNKYITENVRYAYCVVNLRIYLDHIEEVYGYNVVENILKEVSDIINKNIEKEEMFARIYKDSFVILSKYEANSYITEKIKKLINEIKDKIKKENPVYELKINAGIYCLKQTDVDLRKAVYYAMQARNEIANDSENVKICSDTLIMKINKNINLEKNILEALNNKEFCAYVQPLLNLNNKEIQEVEVLARWESPKYGLIRPGAFLNILEKNNYMKKLDYYMYEMACKSLSELKDNDKELFTVFCNFSISTLEDKNFYENLEQISKKYEIPEKYIGIIIEKNVINKGIVNMQYIIEKLKDKGYIVLLNNFESLSYSLRGINPKLIDYVKISSKVTEDLEDLQNIAILKGIIDTVHSLGIKVICEDFGKSNNEYILQKLGCDRIQGYSYHQPVPIKIFSEMK